MAPLSCKFDQCLTVLGKSYEECSYLGTLNVANELSKPNLSAISSLLLLKTVKNWSNLHERGAIIYASPCISKCFCYKLLNITLFFKILGSQEYCLSFSRSPYYFT